VWDPLLSNGMHQDWSWARSAEQYVDLYGRTIARMKQTVYA
jgi:starch synthase